MSRKSRKPWGGRFASGTDSLMERFNASIGFDRRMWREDIEGSRAYAEALERAGVITAPERDKLVEGLDAVQAEIERGKFEWRIEDEDVHMAVERRLTELAGPVGGKLHTGRSRNDQVATDLRLWLKGALGETAGSVLSLQLALLEQAAGHTETLLPGFTHLQQAQVVSVAHYLLSFFWMLQRDRERFAGLAGRVDVLPLGSGALAGSAVGIDREWLARRLGFSRVSENSMDAVSDRDPVAEYLCHAALCMTHLSRLAEDLIIYASAGYRYVELSDAYTTGSSLMPQKKNPDSLELVRGKTGRVLGGLTGLLATLKALPSAYNKDMQEDKEPLFDAFDTLADCLRVTAGVVSTMRWNVDVLQNSLDDFLLATDLADYLVRKGMPFREAHEAVGRVVAECEKRSAGLRELPVEVFREISGLFEDDVQDTLDFSASLASRAGIGGSAPDSVRRQIERAREMLEH